jgi:hypothetical protein
LLQRHQLVAIQAGKGALRHDSLLPLALKNWRHFL